LVDERNLKVGVIGVGHLGEYHVQKYQGIPGVELVGVVDTDERRLAEIAGCYRIPAYRHHDELLRQVEAVSLAVPTEIHFDLAKDILSSGVHLLVEKPITYQLEPADTLIRMARENELVLQVGLVERFNPAVRGMEVLLHSPVLLDAQRLNRFTIRGTDVDVVLDLMIHDLDIILHLVPSEVKEVAAVGTTVVTGKTDIANARLVFENGTIANLTASRVSENTSRKIRIFQTDASLVVDCFRRQMNVTCLDGAGTADTAGFPRLQSRSETYPGRDPLMEQIEAFVKAVKDGSEPVVSGEDGRRALKYALRIIEQIERGYRDSQTTR